MGFNTAVMILNDHLHEIERDPAFPQRLMQAIQSANRDIRQHHGGFAVLQPRHADTMQVVAIGGNTMRTLGYGCWDSPDEALLRSLAEQHGFRLVRKPDRRRALEQGGSNGS